MKAAGIREFKAKISQYLADVRRGEVVLITDRGEVVAEVRQPLSPASTEPRVRALASLAAKGEVRLGAPALSGATLREGIASGMTTEQIQAALDDSRGDDHLAPGGRQR